MHLLLSLFLILISFPVLSHQNTLTSDQKEVRWSSNTVPIKIINNSTTSIFSNSLILDSIAEWNSYSSFLIQPVSSSNNQISFSNDFSIYGSAVVGVTEVSYGTNGLINNAKIILNEQNYNFTISPTVPIGSNSIYLKDVVTHELGHFVGLTHSEVLNSSMFYSSFPGQSSLASDDKAGIRNKYDTGFGKIFGYVKGGNHIGVLGTHVQAISRKTGEAIGGISDESGYFEIGGLDLNDTYYLYTSPLKNLNALPGFLASAQTEFCPAAYVGSFFSDCGRDNDGLPTAINLSFLNTEVDVGEVSINCTMRSQEDYNYQKIQTNFTELPIFNYADELRWEKSYVGFFRKSQLSTSTWTASDDFSIDLTGIASPTTKRIKIRLVSQVLGNAIKYEMIVNKGTSPISGSPFKVSTNPENTLKLDLLASNTLSASGNVYHLKIKAKKLDTSDAAYSIPDVLRFGSDQNLPYLIVVSLEDLSSGQLFDSGSNLSDNASCLDAPFTYAVQNSKASTIEDAQGVANAAPATCGTIDPPSGPGGPGNFMMLMSFGFLLSLFISRFSKRGKNFLS